MKKILTKPPKQKIVVIYHGKCPDGFGGAWAAWKKFGARAAYFAAKDRAAPPVPLKNKIVYLIDYTYDVSIMKKLIKDNVRVTAIDHHITQIEATKLTESYSYDAKHSGGPLAWMYFHPGKPVPMLLQYIEDRDIWKWRIPHAHEVLMMVDLAEFDFRTWNRLATDLEDPETRTSYAKKGALLEIHYHSLCEKLIPGAELVSFAGKKIYALNCPYYFASHLGNELAAKTRSLALIWSESGGRINVSLRSVGKTDVSKIAKKYGGGGHRQASGFSFPVGKKLPWKLLPGSTSKGRAS